MIALLHKEDGQDLIEYTLLLAFVALVAAGMFIQVGAGTSSIWTIANAHLRNAGAAAGGSSEAAS